MKVFVFDCETGSLDPKTHSLLSIGAIVMDLDSGEILDEFESYVKLPSLSDYKVTAGAIEKNKIDIQECFEKGLTPDVIKDKLIDLYIKHGCSMVAGHNVIFDIEWVCEHLFKCTRQEFNNTFTYRYLDSLPVMRLFEGHNSVAAGASLEKCASSLGIKIKDKSKLHSALVDVKLTGAILNKFRTIFMGLSLK